MELNNTPGSERVRIGFFGLRNAGKSSLVNRVTNQEMSLVSDVKGTTTDPVQKSMELLPLGPVTIIDTPGFDDEGALGELRVKKTVQTLATCDIAVLVTDATRPLTEAENRLLADIRSRNIPCLIAKNKCDLVSAHGEGLFVSAKTGFGIEELKNSIAAALPAGQKTIRYVGDFVSPGEWVVLVTPIDSAAPKGRMILPQQQAIRDILDAGAVSVVTGVENLPQTLARLTEPPALVITDSQAFAAVAAEVPEDIPLTSFSILMARYKGFLETAVRGAAAIDGLHNGDKVLICEGCTHHRQCEDIGTVKLPRLLAAHTKKELSLCFTSGHGFPEDLSPYALVIHCGGCMLHDNEMRERMKSAAAAGVPMTNYGIAIAHMNGILQRSIAPVLSLL